MHQDHMRPKCDFLWLGSAVLLACQGNFVTYFDILTNCVFMLAEITHSGRNYETQSAGLLANCFDKCDIVICNLLPYSISAMIVTSLNIINVLILFSMHAYCLHLFHAFRNCLFPWGIPAPI